MYRKLATIPACAVLGGCVTQQDQAQLTPQLQPTCSSLPRGSAEYTACLQHAAYQVKAMAVQQEQLQREQLHEFGRRRRNAAAVVQAADPPTQTTQCSWFAGTFTGRSF